jgi:hypothetical protein
MVLRQNARLMTVPRPILQVPQPVLMASYQHGLLSTVVGIALCCFAYPATGIALVAATQLWLSRSLRRNSVRVEVVNERAALHELGYAGSTLLVSRNICLGAVPAAAAQIFLSQSIGLLIAQSLTGVALGFSAHVLWHGYRALKASADVW